MIQFKSIPMRLNIFWWFVILFSFARLIIMIISLQTFHIVTTQFKQNLEKTDGSFATLKHLFTGRKSYSANSNKKLMKHLNLRTFHGRVEKSENSA